MNYCTIQEAWGKQIEQFTNNNDTDSNNNDTYGNNNDTYGNNNDTYGNNTDNTNNNSCNNNNNSCNNNNNKLLKYNEKKQNVSYNINYDETCNCDLLFNHIKKCPKCYNKIKNYFRPKIIEYYHNIIDDNKDIITLILIGLFILLFYKLINNLTKS